MFVLYPLAVTLARKNVTLYSLPDYMVKAFPKSLPMSITCKKTRKVPTATRDAIVFVVFERAASPASYQEQRRVANSSQWLSTMGQSLSTAS